MKMKFGLVSPQDSPPEVISMSPATSAGRERFSLGKPRPGVYFSQRILLPLSILMLSLLHVAYGSDIRIGGLFDVSDNLQKVTLEYTVDRINRNRNLLAHVNLSSQIETIPYSDSFRASRKVCSLLQSGVAAILGPQSEQTSAHVQSICDALEIPHIENTWDYRLTSNAFSINLYPHPSSLGQAYMDVLKTLGWKKFGIIYENNNGLIRVQELLKDKSFDITLWQLPNSDDYRPMLNDAKKSFVTHVVLDVESENIFTVLKQAQQIGMLTSYYNYFVTSLDLHTVELEDFRHGGTNITALRIVDPENPLVQRVIRNLQGRDKMTFLKTEVALMHDAVQLFAKGLDDLDRAQRVVVTPLDCDRDITWAHGNSLINYIKLAQINGLTGRVQFDTEGFRRHVALDIVELTTDRLTKVGTWEPATGANYTTTYKEVQQGIVESLQNKTLIVSSVLTEPYNMLRETREQMTGNDRYEGFCTDLIDEISRILGFNYTIKLVDDGQHGRYDEKKKRWNGMIEELLDQKADLAIGDLTITSEREQVVDFTMPWMNLGITILYQKPTRRPPGIFSFLSPFTVEVWLLVVLAYLAISLILLVLASIASSPGREEDKSRFKSLWFTMGRLLQPGTDQQPKAVSMTIMAAMWWFFTLIIVSSYAASLVTFLNVDHTESPIESVEDLAKQTKIKYGSIYGGATYTFFSTSKIHTYERMFSFMESQHPSVYTYSNEEGVRRVQESYGQYAFMMESSSADYITERNCDLAHFGGTLDSKSYGIALPPGSPYTHAISEAILSLQENGILHALKTRWWKEKRGGGKCWTYETESSPRAIELGTHNFGGVFVILLVGMGLALLVAVCEFVWKSKKLATE